MSSQGNRLLNSMFALATLVAIASVAVVAGKRYSHPRVEGRVAENWKLLATDQVIGGVSGAPHRVVVFSDYRCEHCRRLDRLLASLDTATLSKYSVIWRHYAVLAPESRRASAAVECAAELGLRKQLHRRLVAVFDTSTSFDLNTLLDSIQVRDVPGFLECTRGQHVDSLLQRDVAVAKTLGIIGTPMVLIDSLVLDGVPPVRELTTLLRIVAKGDKSTWP